jgi:hypothetical protein
MLRIVRSLLVSVALVSGAMPVLARPLPNVTPGTVILADNEGGRGGRWRDRREDRREDRDERIIPLDAVISGLMASYPGKPLDARGPMQRGERLIYEIVWLTVNGRQIVIIVDARTGQVMRVHGLD